jgi:hypothetical protein
LSSYSFFSSAFFAPEDIVVVAAAVLVISHPEIVANKSWIEITE